MLDVADIYAPDAFAARVRERFASRADILAATGGDHALNPTFEPELRRRTFKPAAVLIGVRDDGGTARVVLTQRTEHLSAHSGQVAFPGGRLDEGEDAVSAALREAHEEIGLPARDADVLGTFGTYYSGSGYAIAPVVAMLRGAPDLTPNPDEVADIFEVPLAFLMDQACHRLESRHWKGQERFFYTMPYDDDGRERRIWGVTAGIIRMVQERLYGTAR